MNPALKVVFALMFAPTALITVLVVIMLGSTPFILTKEVTVLEYLVAFRPHMGMMFAAVLLTGLLGWHIHRAQQRVLENRVSMTYADFSKALRGKQVVVDLYSRGKGEYHLQLSRSYLLEDGRVAAIQGSLNPRRDRDNYRYFQHSTSSRSDAGRKSR